MRYCTICLWWDRKVPATHVAADASGLEWFECEGHGPDATGTQRVSSTPIGEWAQAHGLNHVGQE